MSPLGLSREERDGGLVGSAATIMREVTKISTTRRHHHHLELWSVLRLFWVYMGSDHHMRLIWERYQCVCLLDCRFWDDDEEEYYYWGMMMSGGELVECFGSSVSPAHANAHRIFSAPNHFHLTKQCDVIHSWTQMECICSMTQSSINKQGENWIDNIPQPPQVGFLQVLHSDW